MKKNVLKGIGIGSSIIILSLLGMYLGLAQYYSKGFSYGTWINGVYCTGKSIHDINAELLKQCDYEGLTIIDHDGKSYAVLSEDVDLSYDYAETLKLYLERQNPYLWIDNLISVGNEKKLLPVVSYDKDKLNEKMNELPIFHGKMKEDRIVEIQKGADGFFLVNERMQVLNEDRARAMILESFDTFENMLNLVTADCYEDLFLTEEMQQTLSLWSKIEEYQNCGIVYQFGDESYPIDAKVVCNWILVDEDGEFVLDENGQLCTDEAKVDEFIERLCDEYDTVGATRQFMSTRGELVSVEGGTYGNKIDRMAEKEYLLPAFLEKRCEIHEPIYIQKAIKQGKDDIGDTYIEVDITQQKLYYYVKGEQLIATDVVTGNSSLRRDTPTGVNFVYAKQRNRVLHGADYDTPVKFWIPVRGAIGIHDASWRSTYGGSIYQKSGSHGCINTPYEEVAKLYDMVEIGTPCIILK